MPKGYAKNGVNWGQFKKGMIHPRGMLGKHLSMESKQKISEAHKKSGHKPPSFLGKHLSEEAKKKVSEARKGKKFSIEHRKKLSEIKKGKKPWGGKGLSKDSIEKIRKSKIGKNNPQWKGGITPITFQIRRCFQSRQWRSDIFTRDNFTCVLCDKSKCYIEADHYPKMFSTIFQENNIKSLEDALACEEFWNLNNGRTLCRKCHDKTKLGRKKKNEF